MFKGSVLTTVVILYIPIQFVWEDSIESKRAENQIFIHGIEV